MPQLWQISKVFGVMFGVNFGFRVSASHVQFIQKFCYKTIVKRQVRTHNQNGARTTTTTALNLNYRPPLHTMATRTPQQNKNNSESDNDDSTLYSSASNNSITGDSPSSNNNSSSSSNDSDHRGPLYSTVSSISVSDVGPQTASIQNINNNIRPTKVDSTSTFAELYGRNVQHTEAPIFPRLAPPEAWLIPPEDVDSTLDPRGTIPVAPTADQLYTPTSSGRQRVRPSKNRSKRAAP